MLCLILDLKFGKIINYLVKLKCNYLAQVHIPLAVINIFGQMK